MRRPTVASAEHRSRAGPVSCAAAPQPKGLPLGDSSTVVSIRQIRATRGGRGASQRSGVVRMFSLRARRCGILVVAARVRRMLLLAGLVFAALPIGSALANTTVGQTGPPMSDNGLGAGVEHVQTDAAMTTAGTVTSFQFESSNCEITGFVKGSFDFQVLRPLGGSQYRVLGDTGNKTDPCNSQLVSYPVNSAVRAGDVIGVYVVSNWRGLLTVASGSLSSGFPASEPGVGDIVTVPFGAEIGTIDESATLASQNDNSQGQNNNNQGQNTNN